MYVLDGVTGGETPRQSGSAEPGPSQPAKESTAQALRRLLSDREAVQVLGVGDRTFAELIATADWLPTPIVFGPRLRRWDVDELLLAARAKAPRGAKGASEPAQLRRARIERMKATGNAGAGE